MISRLSIRNLILIEEAEIEFARGLNLITGETGSGKSALLMALRLIGGDRADSTLIRPGASQAIIEAEIDGILYRRELKSNGKSRAFRDDEQISLSELKALPLSIVDQSSSPLLTASDAQRELLDRFARSPLSDYSSLYRTAQSLQSDSPDAIQEKLSLIEEVNPQPNEEENLTAEHNRLTHAHSLLERAGALFTHLNDELIPTLRRLPLDPLIRLDPTLAPLSPSCRTALLEMMEASRFLEHYLSSLEPSPERLVQIEDRIGALERLKRLIGPNPLEEQSQLKHKLRALETALEQLNSLARALTASRQAAAAELERLLLEELQGLNLKNARFRVELTPTPLGPSGAERVSFLFSANPGHPLLPLADSASGGELSRLLLAIECAITHRSDPKTLIFDEIDSNVGGETAALLGSKLQSLSQHRQVICVTHFVQVARFAIRHFRISKEHDKAVTRSRIEQLTGRAIDAEYERMVAGKGKNLLR